MTIRSALCHHLAILTTLLFVSGLDSAYAQQVSIYYDYVENDKLSGGRILVDLSDAARRDAFGLAEAARGAPAIAAVWPVTTIRNSGPVSNRIDIVVLGDGYTAGEMNTYAAHVSNAMNNFFAQEPLASYATYFNVHRVDVVSNESGVDEPASGIFRDTALDMAYDCGGIDRLLCVNVSKAYAAAASAPDIDQILVLANSTRYGGAGYPSQNLGTLAGNNASAVEIALHEFGHSFADLADEYDYGGPTTYIGGEPFEPNISIYDAATQVAQQRKWWRWMDLAHVNTFEGANYSQFGIYRPTFNSKMRSLARPFQEVNDEQFVLSMYETVSPIDEATPTGGTPLSACTMFSVTPVAPTDHPLDVQWTIDGVDVGGATQPTFQPDVTALSAGLHTVRATVTDTTGRVRDETQRAALLTDTRTWSIEVFGAPYCACGTLAAPTVLAQDQARSRYLSIVPGNAAQVVAIRVTLNALDGFPGDNGRVLWVGPPHEYPEEDSSQPGLTFTGAGLQCDPYFRDWSTIDTLHVFGAEIVANSDYDLAAVPVSCADQIDMVADSAVPLAVSTGAWGDVIGPFDGPFAPPQPDFNDVAAVVRKFMSAPDAPTKAFAQLQPNNVFPNRPVDFKDIAANVNAFIGRAYSSLYPGPCVCPAGVVCGLTACTSDVSCGTGLCVDGFCGDACGRCSP